MPRYIDGFVIPVPTARLDEYQRMAELACKVWKEHGAIEYTECKGNDLNPTSEDGEAWARTFTDMAGASDDETVFFSFAIFESKEARDAANEKIMADPRLAEMMKEFEDNPVFDCKRMAFGGFEEFVNG